ncbi:hypothetical protein DSO57_1000227 [Entomophthora muscae]|uniref:Uncharacterized protein n=1 Tax=Entomophthora muscae TaxID=34485 RepID=A0ACC2U7M3_9FUNG|nr:hypothetical protein DSO57_1000227 [Entomophthora muscae]
MKFQGLLVVAGLGKTLAKFVDELYAGIEQIHCAPSEMAQNVEGKAPGINSCFSGTTSLYNATLNEVCSEKCLENIVKASFYVKKQCNIVKPTEAAPIYKNRYLVYNVWADFTATEVVCKRDNEHKVYCLAHFTDAAAALATTEAVNVPLDMARLCSHCNKVIYSRFKAEPHLIPVVSNQLVFHPDLVFKKMAEMCKW